MPLKRRDNVCALTRVRQTSQADASATLKADAIQGCSASDYVAMFDTDRLDLRRR
jgi:hypothetical protein